MDPGLGEDEDTGAAPRTVRSLDTALAIAKDGDKIFLEEGRHTRAQGWQVRGIMIMMTLIMIMIMAGGRQGELDRSQHQRLCARQVGRVGE